MAASGVRWLLAPCGSRTEPTDDHGGGDVAEKQPPLLLYFVVATMPSLLWSFGLRRVLNADEQTSSGAAGRPSGGGGSSGV